MKINRKKLYTLIAIAKNQLGYNDEAHQLVIESLGGVENDKGKVSATTLSDAKLNELYQLYKSKGFKPVHKQKYTGLAARGPAENKKVGYIQHLLVRLEKDWRYADALALKMFKIEQVHWLSDYQANSVIKSLRKQCEREGINLVRKNS